MRIDKRISKQWRGNLLPPRGCMSLFSLPLIIAGLFLVGVAVQPSLFRINLLSPRWVIVTVGLAFLVIGIYFAILPNIAPGRKRRKKAPGITQEFPCQTDYPWSPSGISDDNANIPRRSLWQALPLGSFLAAFHWLIFTPFQRESLPVKGLILAVLGLFDLIFLGLVWQTLYWGWQRLRFGRTQVRFGRFPFYPGTELTVTFEGGERLSITPLSVSLRCIEERSVGFDESPSLECFAIYLDQQQVATNFKGQATISFPLPEDVPGTCLSRKMPTYWELIVKAQIPNGRYEGLFLMPIYSQ
jgi:hypothetical protein